MSGQTNGIIASTEMTIKVTSDDICRAIIRGEFVVEAVEDIAMNCFYFLPDGYLKSEGNGMYIKRHPHREFVKRIVKILAKEDFEWLKNEIKLLQTNKSN